MQDSSFEASSTVRSGNSIYIVRYDWLDCTSCVVVKPYSQMRRTLTFTFTIAIGPSCMTSGQSEEPSLDVVVVTPSCRP